MNPDRLFPIDNSTRSIARELYREVADLPIVSMHGHIEAALLARNEPFSDPASLLVSPDHYVTRMLHSQGVSLDALGVQPVATADEDGTQPVAPDPHSVWRLLCEHWEVLQGTASAIWLSQELEELFDIHDEPSANNANRLYEQIARHLEDPSMLPRAIYEDFDIEVLATTDSSLSGLKAHAELDSDPTFSGKVIPTFRPDGVLDASRGDWRTNLDQLEQLTGIQTGTLDGLLEALEERRRCFVNAGAVATDHGHPTALTLVLDADEAKRIYGRLLTGRSDADNAERFRAYMLGEMARMSCEDGLVMQLHPGVERDHDVAAALRLGPDIGADFPSATPLTKPLAALLSAYGSYPGFTFIVYTVDEATYGRELAPMASYYPALKIGAPWWFLDAPDAMRRCWRAAVESAGFSNFAGFVDDSRSLCSIRARHDMSRRIVCGELARLVSEHRLGIDSARTVAVDYCYETPKRVFRSRPAS